MTHGSREATCAKVDEVYAYALDTLSPEEAARTEAHLATCVDCMREMMALLRAVTFFGAPADTAAPSASVWERLAQRVGIATAEPEESDAWHEPVWTEVSAGISCKLLSRDEQTDRMSMMVRLEPGIAYPPHTHAAVEELYLLDGELWIDDRKLHPGDYNRAEPGTNDVRVWSETGCTCVLITSGRDVLR